MSPRLDLRATIEDAHAFRAFYDETAPRVYAYLFSRTGSADVAVDLTQETFIEVIDHPATFDGRGDPVPWLIGIARHRLSRYFRTAKRASDRDQSMIRELDVTGDDHAWRQTELRGLISSAMDGLPVHQRAALMLRFADGLSIREVARTIDRSEDATESLIRRARAAFEAAYRESTRDP